MKIDLQASEEESDEIKGVHWAPPHLYCGTHAILPRILDGYDAMPEDAQVYNGITLRLDAQMTADLDWRAIRKEAEILKEKGFLLFWDIYLGMFQRPLDDQTQFLSLSLALEHFRESFWKDFQDCTFGVSLYRGEADFSSAFQWNEIQLSSFKEWMKEQDADR